MSLFHLCEKYCGNKNKTQQSMQLVNSKQKEIIRVATATSQYSVAINITQMSPQECTEYDFTFVKSRAS